MLRQRKGKGKEKTGNEVKERGKDLISSIPSATYCPGNSKYLFFII